MPKINGQQVDVKTTPPYVMGEGSLPLSALIMPGAEGEEDGNNTNEALSSIRESRTKGKNHNVNRPTAWKAGKSAFTDGRPHKGHTWREIIDRVGQEELSEEIIQEYKLPPGCTWKEAAVRMAYLEAFGGNANMLSQIMQRSEPLGSKVTVTHTGDWQGVMEEHAISEEAVRQRALDIFGKIAAGELEIPEELRSKLLTSLKSKQLGSAGEVIEGEAVNLPTESVSESEHQES